jgi:4-carboxymuconolactone decarboxylase
MHEKEPRIAPLEPPYSEEVAAMLAKWMPPGAAIDPLRLFRTLSLHATLSDRMRPLGAAILGRGTIGARARELLILRTCARCGAEYEWGVHVTAFAASAGLDDERVRATVARAPGDLGDAPDDLLLRFADELHDTSTISDGLWAAMKGQWSDAQLLEMIAIAGFYHLISYTVNAARIEREPWAARFPETLAPKTSG